MATNQSTARNPSVLRLEFYKLPHDALVDRDTVAAVRYVNRQTLEAEAMAGGGCAYIRVGRRALYKKADLLSWIERTGRRVENTAQLEAA